MGCCNLHIGLAVSDFLTDLVVNSACNELCERACERNLACDCKSGSRTDHIGFGDTALDESLREIIGESVHLEGALEVGCKSYNSGVCFSCLIKTCAKTASGVFLSCICIFCHNRNQLMLIVSKSLFELRKCCLALFL